MLTLPYVTPAEFRFHPTFLDSNNLVTAGTQNQQNSALLTALLTASTWVDQHLFGHDGSVAAHVRVEAARLRPDRWGRVRYHPQHAPVISVTSIGVGSDPTDLVTVVTPTSWTEQDGRIVVAYLAGAAAAGLDTLQFGRNLSQRGEQLVMWTYVAGWAATQLAAPTAVGDTTLTVVNPIGILGPTSVATGTVLRLWTPGAEEAVTVSAVAGSTITVTAPLVNAHAAGDSIQALPPTIREAVINKAICELLRPNTVTQQQSNRGPSPTSTSKDPSRAGQGGNPYHAKAEGLLRPFGRVR